MFASSAYVYIYFTGILNIYICLYIWFDLSVILNSLTSDMLLESLCTSNSYCSHRDICYRMSYSRMPVYVCLEPPSLLLLAAVSLKPGQQSSANLFMLHCQLSMPKAASPSPCTGAVNSLTQLRDEDQANPYMTHIRRTRWEKEQVLTRTLVYVLWK